MHFFEQELLNTVKAELTATEKEKRLRFIIKAIHDQNNAYAEYKELTGLSPDNFLSLNVKDEKGNTALSLAAGTDHPQLLRILVEANANVDCHNDSLRTPLMRAARRGFTQNADILIQAGAEKEFRDQDSRTALHHAVLNNHLPVTNLLLEAKADLEKKDCDDDTPLNLAASLGHEAMVSRLIESNAQKNTENTFCKTPLHQAAEANFFTVANLLIQAGADFGKKDWQGRTPLFSAARHGSDAVINYLIESKADVDAKNVFAKTPLMEAAQFSRANAVNKLLEAKADVTLGDSRQNTALMFGAQQDKIEVLMHLLKEDRELDKQNLDGDTALILAAKTKQAANMEKLIQLNANLQIRNYKNFNALGNALLEKNTSFAVLQLLILNGMNLEEQIFVLQKNIFGIMDTDPLLVPRDIHFQQHFIHSFTALDARIYPHRTNENYKDIYKEVSWLLELGAIINNPRAFRNFIKRNDWNAEIKEYTQFWKDVLYVEQNKTLPPNSNISPNTMTVLHRRLGDRFARENDYTRAMDCYAESGDALSVKKLVSMAQRFRPFSLTKEELLKTSQSRCYFFYSLGRTVLEKSKSLIAFTPPETKEKPTPDELAISALQRVYPLLSYKMHAYLTLDQWVFLVLEAQIIFDAPLDGVDFAMRVSKKIEATAATEKEKIFVKEYSHFAWKFFQQITNRDRLDYQEQLRTLPLRNLVVEESLDIIKDYLGEEEGVAELDRIFRP